MRITMQPVAGGHLCTVGLTPSVMVGAVGCCRRTALMGACGLAEQTIGALSGSRVSSQLHPGSADAMRNLKIAAWLAEHPRDARAMFASLPPSQRAAVYTVLQRMGVKL